MLLAALPATTAEQQPPHHPFGEATLLTATHHTTSSFDNTQIAYECHGDGPTLLLTNGYTTNAGYFRHIVSHFRDKAKVITWDLRGHGKSAPSANPNGTSIEDCVRDLIAVMDATHTERAALGAFSMGCQVALEAWRHHPDRIAAYILTFGTYGRPFDNLFHPRLGPAMGQLMRLIRPASGPLLRAASLSARNRLSHRLNRVTGQVGRELDYDEMHFMYEHLGEIDGRTWASMGIAAGQHSAGDLLPTISVPTLVISGGRDSMTPQRVSQQMVDAIPGAEQLVFPKATHTGLLEHPETINETIESFLLRAGWIEES